MNNRYRKLYKTTVITENSPQYLYTKLVLFYVNLTLLLFCIYKIRVNYFSKQTHYRENPLFIFVFNIDFRLKFNIIYKIISKNVIAEFKIKINVCIYIFIKYSATTHDVTLTTYQLNKTKTKN